VFRPAEGDVAKFHEIQVGLTSDQLVEVASGLAEGDRIVTTGAAALREGDKIVLPGQRQGGAAGAARGGRRGDGGRGVLPRGGAPQS
jgi:hypothetical protein